MKYPVQQELVQLTERLERLNEKIPLESWLGVDSVEEAVRVCQDEGITPYALDVALDMADYAGRSDLRRALVAMRAKIRLLGAGG